ncbi:hypothetical protein [Bacillus sp. REN3]|uniref:hypothetical protein n=1 Tax=Bacillus sp. REN3 TaxID=2802440 RepID=UPI001AED8011|nr:hypothetical protein [Bacillus sp. REN3]
MGAIREIKGCHREIMSLDRENTAINREIIGWDGKLQSFSLNFNHKRIRLIHFQPIFCKKSGKREIIHADQEIMGAIREIKGCHWEIMSPDWEITATDWEIIGWDGKLQSFSLNFNHKRIRLIHFQPVFCKKLGKREIIHADQEIMGTIREIKGCHWEIMSPDRENTATDWEIIGWDGKLQSFSLNFNHKRIRLIHFQPIFCKILGKREIIHVDQEIMGAIREIKGCHWEIMSPDREITATDWEIIGWDGKLQSFSLNFNHKRIRLIHFQPIFCKILGKREIIHADQEIMGTIREIKGCHWEIMSPDREITATDWEIIGWDGKLQSFSLNFNHKRIRLIHFQPIFCKISGKREIIHVNQEIMGAIREIKGCHREKNLVGQ